MFDCGICSGEITDVFIVLTKTFKLTFFFADTIEMRSFKLCIITSLLGVYRLIPVFFLP